LSKKHKIRWIKIEKQGKWYFATLKVSGFKKICTRYGKKSPGKAVKKAFKLLSKEL